MKLYKFTLSHSICHHITTTLQDAKNISYFDIWYFFFFELQNPWNVQVDLMHLWVKYFSWLMLLGCTGLSAAGYSSVDRDHSLTATLCSSSPNHTHSTKTDASPAFWLALTDPTKILKERRNFKGKLKQTAREGREKDKREETNRALECWNPFLLSVALFLFLKLYYCLPVIFKELQCRCFSAFVFFLLLLLRELVPFLSFIAFLSFCAEILFLWKCHPQMW